MSFLLTNNQTPPAQQVARRLKDNARSLYAQMVRAFNDGAKNFWANSTATPTEIAEALGADAVDVFSLHAKLGALIAQVDPAAVAPGAALVGQFEYNADGSVTITPPPAPEPVPAPEPDSE